MSYLAMKKAKPPIPDYKQLWASFFPEMMRRRNSFDSTDGQFVHYTSAAAVKGWLDNKEVWMRESSTMNDFMELEHGFQCLNNVYKTSLGNRFKAVLERIEEGLSQSAEKFFNDLVEHIRTDTYLACVSEHDPSENLHGRLSMWRAYGGSTPVAVVLNRKPFYAESDTFNVYSAPVDYFNHNDFKEAFKEIVEGLESKVDFLKSFQVQEINNMVFQFFRFSMLCTKHPGFKEEREWRIIYSPTLEPSKYVKSKVELINNTPQLIYKMGLENIPEAGVDGMSPNQLIERIIIGPTEYPRAIRNAFINLMTNAGIENADQKVWVSDIPLRT